LHKSLTGSALYTKRIRQKNFSNTEKIAKFLFGCFTWSISIVRRCGTKTFVLLVFDDLALHGRGLRVSLGNSSELTEETETYQRFVAG
jgi:hypothetical protein